jgi:hydroxyacyl-ACP dehydratase HTD2-like protein with hotdog domain
MLDQDPDKWSDGDLLPRGWQFVLLGADTKRSGLREDGFPGLGVSLPDLGLPRLMLGGRTVHYYGDIRVGAVLRRESQILNSHKIHLDRNFARETEGFPDLVVNGGLATLLLTEFLRLELKSKFTSLTAKHVAPLFCGRPVSLWGERQNEAWLLRAFDDHGGLAVEIEVRP